MRYTIITGQIPSLPGYEMAHYLYPSSYHPHLVPYIWWQPSFTVPGQHGIHHVYYFR
ncbi:hypothetical protein [Metabacillus sp. Hm71]|uniref:hypothetical protein n=1 Tax=Metabacillus sp. Hm71 TaxID=3450743 RepID=UPI003F427CB8